jgi:hypothetical protein
MFSSEITQGLSSYGFEFLHERILAGRNQSPIHTWMPLLEDLLEKLLFRKADLASDV